MRTIASAKMTINIEVKNLDHLGIVAGITDGLGVENIIDSRLGTDSREKITAGKIVKAIILNGLGFVSKPLYLFPEFFQDKAVEELLGEGIKAEEINDDKLGRVMDEFWEYGLEKIWLEIVIEAVKKYEIQKKYSHLDSTSISVQGQYKDAKEGYVEITYGYSKDHRSDLKQFMINLMVSSDGDVPLLIKMGSGNESDKTRFASIISEYKKQVNWETIYVADSGLYTAPNLHKLGGTKWISRVPLTIKKAKEMLERIEEKELIDSEKEGYKYKEEEVDYHGIAQRWLVVENKKRKKSNLEQISKNIKKEREKIEKKLKKWNQKRKKDLKDLKVEVKQFIEKLKYHEIVKITYEQGLNKKEEKISSCEGKIKEKVEVIKKERKKAGRFIIATNILNRKEGVEEKDQIELSPEEMLDEYKSQQSCERGFRFLKDPLFLASSIFLKSSRRIETMGMLMGLCLLVYTIGQRMLRQELALRKGAVKNSKGKLTSSPTLRWIFQVLQGIHVVTINAEKIVTNLTDEMLEILNYFTVHCQKYYLINQK